MKLGTRSNYHWAVLLTVALSAVGCGDRERATRVATRCSTVEQVCNITADILQVDRAGVHAHTSLRDLHADELDFVELIMELEDHFSVTIPDETAERMAGTNNWRDAVNKVTMAKLASVIDERRQFSESGGSKFGRGITRTDATQPDLTSGSSELPTPDGPQPARVKVFVNPLVMLLAGAEKQRARPLTHEEVLEVRDTAAFVMMSPEQAQKFYSSLDASVPVHRMDPDRVWEEWQEIRGQLK